jgi:hypothetical protein
MSAGNSSNTVFTAIPVGEDFYMSFSTERFFHNISPLDVETIVFKLYDARLIGDVGSPNPNAIIETVDSSVFGLRFAVTDTKVSVLVNSSTLDAYETARTNGATTVFRGELYGFAELVVDGEETGEESRLIPADIVMAVSIPAVALQEAYWDGVFYEPDVQDMAAATSVPAVADADFILI